MSVSEMPGAEVSRRLLAEAPDGAGSFGPPEDPWPEEPGESEAAADRSVIVAHYTPIHWPDLWADTTEEGPDWLVYDLLEHPHTPAP